MLSDQRLLQIHDEVRGVFEAGRNTNRAGRDADGAGPATKTWDCSAGRAGANSVPALLRFCPFSLLFYAVFGEMRTDLAWGAFGSSMVKTPSFKIALTFELSTSAGR